MTLLDGPGPWSTEVTVWTLEMRSPDELRPAGPPQLDVTLVEVEIPTPELNRFLGDLRSARPGPARNGRRLNLLYGTQVESRPPRFRFFVNDPGLLTRDYAYWVENRMRDRFALAGVPVVIDFVRRS